MADYDSPWKEALDEYFEAFVGLFFPAMHAEIDWERGHEPLDKELQQIVADAEDGRRIVDKLVQVWRKSGEEEWVLIHVEVQGQPEKAFAERMFLYNCKLTIRYNKKVASVAVLADENRAWRPDRFQRELWGCANDFRFPTVKLIDYAAQSDELERSDNPFARFVLAYLKALETKKDNESRYVWKMRLLRSLLEYDFESNKLRGMFRLIDWVIALPPELEQQFRHEFIAMQKENHMPYVTSFERLAKEEGREEGWKEGREEGREEGWKEGREEGREEGWERGLKRGIRAMLKARFDDAGLRLMPEIEAIHDGDLLETILDRAETIASPDDLRACWK